MYWFVLYAVYYIECFENIRDEIIRNHVVLHYYSRKIIFVCSSSFCLYNAAYIVPDESTKMRMFSCLRSLGNTAQSNGEEMRLSRFKASLPHHKHKMATVGRFHDNWMFWRHCLRLANGNWSLRSGLAGYSSISFIVIFNPNIDVYMSMLHLQESLPRRCCTLVKRMRTLSFLPTK